MAKPNWGAGATGAAGGALAGAQLGSFFPVVGTGIGAGVGGVAGGLIGLLSGKSGKKDKIKNHSRMTPEQQNLLNEVMSSLTGGGGQFGDLYGQFNPEQAANTFQQGVANPALRNFNQRVIPGIQQAFADQGASSGLNNSLATAGRDLQEGLDSQLAMFIQNQQNMQNQNRIQGINQGLNTQAYTPYLQQGNSGMVPQLLSGFSQGAGQAAGKWGANYLENLWNPQQGAAAAPVAGGGV